MASPPNPFYGFLVIPAAGGEVFDRYMSLAKFYY